MDVCYYYVVKRLKKYNEDGKILLEYGYYNGKVFFNHDTIEYALMYRIECDCLKRLNEKNYFSLRMHGKSEQYYANVRNEAWRQIRFKFVCRYIHIKDINLDVEYTDEEYLAALKNWRRLIETKVRKRVESQRKNERQKKKEIREKAPEIKEYHVNRIIKAVSSQGYRRINQWITQFVRLDTYIVEEKSIDNL